MKLVVLSISCGGEESGVDGACAENAEDKTTVVIRDTGQRPYDSIEDKGVTKRDTLGPTPGHADEEGERFVHRQVYDRMIHTVTARGERKKRKVTQKKSKESNNNKLIGFSGKSLCHAHSVPQP